MAKGKNKNYAETAPEHITDIPHEEVKSNGLKEPAPQVIEAEEVTIETTIKRELARFDINMVRINEMKAEFSGLKIAGPEDKDGYNKVKKAWQIVRGARLNVEKRRKEIKADYLKIGQEIDAKAREYTEELDPLEGQLKAEYEAIDKIEEDRKAEIERKAQEALQSRVVTLIDNGMAFNGSFYAIGPVISVDVVTIKNFSEADFNQLLDRVKIENERIKEEARLEAEKKEQERLALEKQKQEQEEERIRLENERKAQEEERLAMLKERTDQRIEVLEGLGFIQQGFAGFSFKKWENSFFISMEAVEKYTAQPWAELLDRTRQDVARANEEAKQRELKEKEEAEKKEARRRQHEERRQFFFNLGFQKRGDQFVFTSKYSGDWRTSESFLDYEEEDWKVESDFILKGIQKMKEADAEADQKAQRTNLRIQSLKDLFQLHTDKDRNLVRVFQTKEGDHTLEVTVQNIEDLGEDLWAEFKKGILLKVNALQKEEDDYRLSLQQKAEEERKSQLSDSDRALEYLQLLDDTRASNFPHLQNKVVGECLRIFNDRFAAAMQELKDNLVSLKNK